MYGEILFFTSFLLSKCVNLKRFCMSVYFCRQVKRRKRKKIPLFGFLPELFDVVCLLTCAFTLTTNQQKLMILSPWFDICIFVYNSGRKYCYIQEEDIEALSNCYLWFHVNVILKFIFTLFLLVQTRTLILFSS